MTTKSTILVLPLLLSVLTAGCGVAEQGASSSVVRIQALEASSGAKIEYGGNLLSDVITLVQRDDKLGGPYFSIYNDVGRVTMALALKDPGAPGVTNVPSPLNVVTFTHYRVVYRRTDGHNIEGVDVPYSFDSGLTFTVPADGSGQASFEIVRHAAKEDAPLKALASSSGFISTVTDVTFYGKDQGGKNVEVTGSIGISFGNFADPTS